MSGMVHEPEFDPRNLWSHGAQCNKTWAKDRHGYLLRPLQRHSMEVTGFPVE
jgi:hypothetical protein